MVDPLLFISAGDPSGDIACARVAESLRLLRPNLQLVGLGGPRLQAMGQTQLADISDLAVVGFWEVFKRLSYFRQLMDRAVETIEKQRPSCILLVDYPGFNLRLAERVRKFGIPIVYYISPQMWAWGRKRVEQMRRLVDQVLVILPFEEDFFRSHDVNATFVGHYLLEDIPAAYIQSLPPRNCRLALLPGSRRQEIERILPVMLETAREFTRQAGYSAVVSGIPGRFDYEALLRTSHSSIQLSFEDSRRLIYESDFALAASGTVTLEAGIIGRPMVVVYKTHPITYQIARRLVKIDAISLVNLVLGEQLVPELIQQDASSERMLSELDKLRFDTTYYERVRVGLNRIPGMLHGVGASDRAASIISSYL